MSDDYSDLIRLEVRCDQDAPSVVRDALQCAISDTELRQDARLVASELVTNAVMYSGAGPDQMIEFRATFLRDALLLSVRDPCIAGQNAHLRPESGPKSGGFGLRIVDRLAARWGTEHPDGQRVWAELPLAS